MNRPPLSRPPVPATVKASHPSSGLAVIERLAHSAFGGLAVRATLRVRTSVDGALYRSQPSRGRHLVRQFQRRRRIDSFLDLAGFSAITSRLEARPGQRPTFRRLVLSLDGKGGTTDSASPTTIPIRIRLEPDSALPAPGKRFALAILRGQPLPCRAIFQTVTCKTNPLKASLSPCANGRWANSRNWKIRTRSRFASQSRPASGLVGCRGRITFSTPQSAGSPLQKLVSPTTGADLAVFFLARFKASSTFVSHLIDKFHANPAYKGCSNNLFEYNNHYH